MQHPQGSLQDVGQGGKRRRQRTGAQPDLGHLDVPVAKIVPDEFVELLLGVPQFEVLQRGVDFCDEPIQAAQNPAVFPVLRRGQFVPAGQSGLPIKTGENKSSGIPDFVGEVAGGLHPGFGESQVVARCCAGGQSKPESICPIALQQLQGIQGIAPGLAHLGARRVPDQPVDENGVKRHFSGVLDAQHDHSGDPEKQDVVTRFQHRGGVEVA